MKINALLDLDVVAVESEDNLSVLLELVAPTRAVDRRPPGTLQVVLDRSGSMGAGRLHAAHTALESLVSRLDPSDNFGVVVFDDEAQVVIPAGPLADKGAAVNAIRSVWPGSMTNLSSGYLRGIQEARRVSDGRGSTLLLLSDGHANRGVTDHDQLATVAAGARQRDVTTSTIGLGLGYDESLMATIARGGGGNTRFAEEGDEAGAAVASEVDDLLEQSVQAAHLTVRPSGAVSQIHLLNDLPTSVIEAGFMIDLGDFYSGEQRRLMLEISVPSMAALGLAQICELELSYVDVATLASETVKVPVHVNVVPGDQAAGRIPDPTVTSERCFQEAQRAKKEATDALRAGDRKAASDIWARAGEKLRSAAADAPPEMGPELLREAALLGDYADRAAFDNVSLMAKSSEMDRHLKERKRGRRPGRGA